jgi:hypothetical protein
MVGVDIGHGVDHDARLLRRRGRVQERQRATRAVRAVEDREVGSPSRSVKDACGYLLDHGS